jgi:pyrroloquinoline-quinone synthase
MSPLLEDPVVQMFASTARQYRSPWHDLSSCTSFDAAVVQVAEIYDFQWHPYLLWMQSQAVDRTQFLQSQLPFRDAVESFPQSLAAVLAKLDRVESRFGVVKNISESQGYGNPLRSHKAEFRQYLQALGATSEELTTAISTPVLAFNQSTRNYCLTQSPEAGAAMLGMIEYLYIDISAKIAKTIHDRLWVMPGAQSHYIPQDIGNYNQAQDLFLIAESGWEFARSRQQIAEGLILGGRCFWDLYDGLYPEMVMAA